MGLLNTTATAATFESADEAVTDVKTVVDAGNGTITSVNAKTFVDAVTTAVAIPQANTAVAIPRNHSVGAVRRPIVAPIFEGLREAFPVEYNTLPQIICSNGNFVCREDKKNLGDTVVFELQSFQDSFVVSPNDDSAPTEVLRFSNDGVVCNDEEGTLVADHLNWLHENGYPNASLKQRAVVVGMIEATAKGTDMVDELVQFDLSPKSRVMWERFLSTTSFKLSKGKLTEDKVLRIKATTTIASSSGGNDFTQAKFDLA